MTKVLFSTKDVSLGENQWMKTLAILTLTRYAVWREIFGGFRPSRAEQHPLSLTLVVSHHWMLSEFSSFFKSSYKQVAMWVKEMKLNVKYLFASFSDARFLNRETVSKIDTGTNIMHFTKCLELFVVSVNSIRFHLCYILIFYSMYNLITII
jgi:hypothetical protein